jgi:large subunit ribosomal protein L21
MTEKKPSSAKATEDKKTTKKTIAKKAPAKKAIKKDSGVFAVIETGGKQYIVREDDNLKVEKLKTEEGKTIVFDKVLLVSDGKDIKLGTPYVKGATVEAKSEGNIRNKKVVVLKYKPKTRYRVKKGHRQINTKITITKIK